MPQNPATCPLDCPEACGIEVHTDAEGAFLRVGGRADHPWSRGVLCGKTAQYGELVTSPDRLHTPLLRDASGGFRRATWEEAIARIVEGVGGLVGERILALPYAGSMGAVARLFPMRTMHALGTSLTDGGICDSTATEGFERVFGAAEGADLEEVEEADFVVLWGCDAARTLQHIQPRLREILRRGGTVVAIDIYRTDTIRRLESWGGEGLVLRPGTDAALALGLARVAFEEGLVDRDFLARECEGAEAFETHALASASPEESEGITGVSAERARDFLRRIAAAERPFWKTGVGWTRRRNGGESMRSVLALASILGQARCVHYESFANFELPYPVLARPDLRPSAAPTPIQHVAVGRELEAGRYDAVFIWGHNPVVVCPDSRRVRAGLSRPDVFTVVHDAFLTETAECADVVLPSTLFVEHDDVYPSYGHRHLHRTRAVVKPPGEARSNVQTFAAIARALGLPEPCWKADAPGLCDEFLGASREFLGEDGLETLESGTTWKVKAGVEPGRPWKTASGRIELVSQASKDSGRPWLPTYVPDDGGGSVGSFELICTPSKHTHNSTFHHSPRHIGRAGTPTVHVHPDDARGLGVEDGEGATLVNAQGRVTLRAHLDPEMPRGLLRVDGIPRSRDIPEGVGINALVPPTVSDHGDGNVLYSTRVDLVPARVPASQRS